MSPHFFHQLSPQHYGSSISVYAFATVFQTAANLVKTLIVFLQYIMLPMISPSLGIKYTPLTLAVHNPMFVSLFINQHLFLLLRYAHLFLSLCICLSYLGCSPKSYALAPSSMCPSTGGFSHTISKISIS